MSAPAPGSQSTPAPPDAHVRERIVTSRGVNLSVEAGAGTGKTTLLVDRLLALLAGGTPVRRLAVITFTRKAAAELAARLRRKLTEARGAGHEWAALALGELDGAAIGTTDSFCRAILADFPLQARLPPGFTLIDEIGQEALLDLAWERCLARAGDAEDRLFGRLRELGVRPTVLRSLGAEIADHRDLSIAPTSPTSGEAGDLVALFEAALAPARAAAATCRDPDDLLLRRVRELALDLEVARDLGGGAAERILLRARQGKRRYAKKVGRASAWGGADGKAAVVNALVALDERVDEALRVRGAELASEVADWLRAYTAEYERAKRERGVVDFRDLAVETRKLLQRPGPRERIAARWDALLLDEVQDTDPLQMEIAFLLAAARANAEDPLASELRPGALFLVGDPKQSIYRFRRADIELYQRARERIAADGEALLVSANFRSHPSILRFANRVFEGWMDPPPGETWQARYEPLEPGREARPDDGEIRASVLLGDPVVRAELLERSGQDRLRARERGELEIDAVVRMIRRVLGQNGDSAWTVRDPDSGEARPARPRDVAVLVRKIAWGDLLLDALRRAGVPAVVSGGKRFQHREEVRTLATLLETIVHPMRPLARFAALRSPAFALPDDDLVRRFDPSDAPAEASERLADAEATLDALAALARASAVPEFLERLCEETALLAAFGLRIDGPGRVESLRLLVEAADSLADAGLDTLPDFTRWLAQQESTLFGELVPESGDAVEILTMHKAKGLEFPVVVLADLASATWGGASILCERATGRIEFRLPGAPEVATAGWEEAAEREKLRAHAEEIRLLYVAATRARDHLVISWPEAETAFLRELPQRLGGRAGAAIDSDVVRTLRAEDLPRPADADTLLRVDVEAAVRLARADAAIPFPTNPSAAPVRGPATRIVPATVVAAPPPADVPEPVGAGRTGCPNGWDRKQFGTFLHKCLEIAEPTGRGIEDARHEALARLGWTLDEADGDALSGELRRLDADPLLIALREESADSGREVPFLLPVDGGFVSGTIDLLLEHPDGSLTVVDYKSGRAPRGLRGSSALRESSTRRDPGAPHAPERHRAQAALYAWAAHQLTGRPVREVRIVFLGDHPVSQRSFPGDESFREEGRALVADLA